MSREKKRRKEKGIEDRELKNISEEPQNGAQSRAHSSLLEVVASYGGKIGMALYAF